jgi:superfamily II DNA or RNA helicase
MPITKDIEVDRPLPRPSDSVFEAPLKIIRANGYYIPIKNITERVVTSLEEKFTYFFFKEEACKNCEHLDDRPSETCDSCAAFLGGRTTQKPVQVGKSKYWKVPRGGKKRLLEVLTECGYSNLELQVERPDSEPFSRAIKTTVPLRDYQEAAVATALKKKFGIIEAPPRSGKTLMGAAIACRVGKKTLIIAHQSEWLKQFRETFIGSETAEAFTNAKPEQVRICTKLEEFQATDVCLATFATFFSEQRGKKLLQDIADMFEVVVIDEVHGVPAKESSRVLAAFNATYIIGLTGTPARKVTEEFKIANDLVGQVIYKAEIDRLRPRVELLNMPKKEWTAGMGQASFTSLVSRLESNTVRKTTICKRAIELAKQGHLVLIPLSRVNAILEWTRYINEETETAGFALPFYGGLPKSKKVDRRMEIVNAARQYKCKILVGNIALLSVGLNVPRASAIVECGLNSNLPKAQQRISRILTPMDGKPDPLIVFTLDDCDIMRSTRRNEYWNAVKPGFNPIVPQPVEKELMQWFSNTKKRKKNYVDYGSVREGL